MYEKGSIVQNENVALIEVFKQTFCLVKKVCPEKETEEDKGPAADLFKFILTLACDPVNEKYKNMATYDSRIFNFDKPNKYKEEVKLMRAVQENIDQIPFRNHFQLETFNEYLFKIDSPRCYEAEANDMMTDPFKRNEYIFTRVLLKAFVGSLLSKKVLLSPVETAVGQVWL